ncbi:MAG: polyketide synthase, partial [Bradymonadaceae bacterium]
MGTSETEVAIVGMAGRFAGADSVEKLWSDVIRPGKESIEHFDVEDEDDDEAVGGYGILEGAAEFDNEFFDIPPAEARRTSPQHRLFLEYVFKALESAGIDVENFDGYASLYGSCSMNSSYLKRVLEVGEDEDVLGGFGLKVGHDKDFLATRVGYRLGLEGECMTVQTACSSSLIGTHLACQSIMSGQSDVAMAGGVSIMGSLAGGDKHHFETPDGFIRSPDWHCRAFTAEANGTVMGDGVGVVVLKPLDEAIEDGNTIYGVISGSAVNNDGNRKVGYTAPSVDGQVDIEDALAFSGVDRNEIGYIECHGTGTEIGDDVELRALRKVFESDRSGPPIQLGTIKSNIGHLDAGAGTVGLIKAALTLYHRGIPPQLHVDEFELAEQVLESDALEVPAEYRD